MKDNYKHDNESSDNGGEITPAGRNQLASNPSSSFLAKKLRRIAEHEKTPSLLQRILPFTATPLDKKQEEAELALADAIYGDWVKTAELRAEKGRQALSERLSRLLAELKIRERGDLITFAARDHTRVAAEFEEQSETIIAILRTLEERKSTAQTESEKNWFDRRQRELLRRADEKFAQLLDGYDRACDDYLAQ